MKRLSSVLVAVLVATIVPAAGGVVAPAATAAALPIGTVRDMIVDTAHGKVFLSGKTVAATDLSGNVLGTIDGFTNAGRMSLSADGTHVLVIDGTNIKSIDAATSVVDKTLPLGDEVCPASLAPASGKVFFSYASCGTSSPPGQLGAVDLGTGTVATELPVGSDSYGGRLAAIPGQPNRLVANLGGTLAIVDTVGGDTPSASIHTSISLPDLAYFTGMMVSGDGSKVYVGRSGRGFFAYTTSDLTQVGAYPVNGDSADVAVRADGLLALTSADHDYDYLRIYKPGVSTPFASTRYGRDKAPFVIGFGTKYLYGVFKASSLSASSLTVLTPGPPAALTLTTDRSAYAWKGDATVVAKLGSPTTSRKVAIFAKSYGGTERLLKSGTVSVTGKLIVTVPDLKVNTTFRAVFKSDGTYGSASVSKAVTVAAKVTLTSRSTSVTGGYHRLPASPSPAVLGQLYAGSGGGCVRVIGYRLVSGAWHRFDSIECIHQSGSRSFVVALVGFKRGDRLKVTARYQGSAGNTASPAATYYVLLT